MKNFLVDDNGFVFLVVLYIKTIESGLSPCIGESIRLPPCAARVQNAFLLSGPPFVLDSAELFLHIPFIYRLTQIQSLNSFPKGEAYQAFFIPFSINQLLHSPTYLQLICYRRIKPSNFHIFIHTIMKWHPFSYDNTTFFCFYGYCQGKHSVLSGGRQPV